MSFIYSQRLVMSKILYSLCLFVYSYAISINGFTQTISVVTEDAPSLQYQKTSGEMAGPAAKLIEKVFNESGLSFETRVLPWARAYKEANLVPNTLIYSMVRTIEREDKFHWIGIISKPKYYFFALKNTEIPSSNNIKDFSKYRVGSLLSSASYSTLKAQGFEYLVPVTTAKQVFQLLTKNRVDLITANLTAFDEICQHHSTECSQIKAIAPIEPLNNRALYFAMNKDSDPKVVQRLRRSYQKLLKENKIKIL
ncbi:hypothetical protein D1094_00445 [Colwellia sp. RSH04]|nr:hypothetical protein D1094_00445 [Colwellia sp. RSH04]